MDDVELLKKTARVIAECGFHTGLGVGSLLGNRKVIVDPGARTFWIEKHMKTIPYALKRAAEQGLTWEDERHEVLPEAVRLGVFAAAFAIADDREAEVITIKEEHVRKASNEVASAPKCRVAKMQKRGGYCEGEGNGGPADHSGSTEPSGVRIPGK